ncbi:MAG: ankyrin repeat domain-containing protein [Syntrophomonadaceae bacterium]
MKYCGQCGLETGDEAAFCRSCGSPFSQSQDDSMIEINSGSESANASGVSTNESFIESHFSSDKPQNPLTGLNASPASSSSSAPKSESSRKGVKFKILFGSILVLILVAGGFWGWKYYGTEARVQAKLDLGIKYLSENDYEKAILAFDDAIKINPKEVKGHQGLAKTYTIQGKYDEARAAYEKGSTTVEQEYRIVLQLGLAGMYIDKGDLPQAEVCFREIINNNKHCIEAYVGLAQVYQQQGGKDKALAILEQCIKENSQDYRAYNALAMYYADNSDNSDKEKALPSLAKSLELEVNQQEAYLVLEALYQGNWVELINKSDATAGAKTATVLKFFASYSDKKYSEALSLYHASLEADKRNQKVRVLAALCLFGSGDKTAADALIKELAKEKMNGWIMADLARYYLIAGDGKLALEWADKSQALEAGNTEALRVLAGVYAGDNILAKTARTKYMIYSWQSVMEMKKKGEEVFASVGQTGSTEKPIAQTEQKPSKPASYKPELSQPLIDAIKAGNVEQVKSLLEQGANPNSSRDGKVAALFVTGSNGRLIMRALIQAGADLTRTGTSQATGVHILSIHAVNQETELVDEILKSGFPVDYRDTFGYTALLTASCMYCDVKTIKVLLDAGADPNARDREGNTPLTNAAGTYDYRDAPAVVKLLLENGADPNIRNNNGYTPLKLAKDKPELVEILRKAGAKE